MPALMWVGRGAETGAKAEVSGAQHPGTHLQVALPQVVVGAEFAAVAGWIKCLVSQGEGGGVVQLGSDSVRVSDQIHDGHANQYQSPGAAGVLQGWRAYAAQAETIQRLYWVRRGLARLDCKESSPYGGWGDADTWC